MTFEDYRYTFGVYFTNSDDEPIVIPESVGRVIQRQKKGRDVVPGTEAMTVKCSEEFKSVNLKLTETALNAKENGHCYNPRTGFI